MRIGVDLGGSKIEVAALDDAGAIRHRRRVATPAGDYAATVRAVADLVHAADQVLGLHASVGVATPGALAPATGLIKNSNSTCLLGQPLAHDLRTAIGRPVRLANDADCFTLSEAVDGAGAGARVVFGVIVGTGTGGGIAVQGRLLQGPNAITGEWGHNPLPWPAADELPGPACYCGKHGCIETFLSGPGLAAAYRAATGREFTAQAVAQHAARGEAAARDVLQCYARRMARALAGVINILDPDVIVLGGGLSNIEWLYQAVPDYWQDYVFSDVVTTPLRRARHGDSSGVRGAAWLWP